MDLGPNFVGMTVAEAKAAANKAGWTGEIDVYQEAPEDPCKAGTVCRFAPSDWKIKIGTHAQLNFYVNPTP